MIDLVSNLAIIGYFSINSIISYFLLHWKGQHPKSANDVFGMVFINIIVLGLLPIAPFLMKHPPDRRQRTSDDYYKSGKIWIWNQ